MTKWKHVFQLISNLVKLNKKQTNKKKNIYISGHMYV